ncbi:hypothetical protein GVY41_18095 [Frigidibacter albus]|uniref:Outer membrane beta-barrel protein n=1 Tax=Frigidibacter albus TaxID=1465486 RepID=A0A6L8VNI8_9RHOB|nr:hypothetical protein [Frigidibacter albus]MZQ91032.1 hypothetical protein [Frigidibacter albus]NBE32917.1 hypothetical protein [Frigidibacter albus]GGH62166.1 hypothetical protein GCM10011341_36080 [Frigidibacter albus]
MTTARALRPRSVLRGALAAVLLAGPLAADPAPFPERNRKTFLIGIREGSQLSADVRSVRAGGYELADGTPIDFDRWYSTDWTDLGVTFLTQVTPGLGVLWGASTGERGEKYRIDPALTLGVILQRRIGKRAFATLTAQTILGGNLREDTCMADYGAIGGVQEVNCRLAASTLAPAETLDYLLDAPAYDRHYLKLVFTWEF